MKTKKKGSEVIKGPLYYTLEQIEGKKEKDKKGFEVKVEIPKTSSSEKSAPVFKQSFVR